MGTILYICKEHSSETDRILKILEEEQFSVVLKNSAEEGLSFVKESDSGSMIVLVDTPSMLGRVRDLIDFIHYSNDFLFMTPVLLVSDQEHLDADTAYLGGAAVDIIEKPVNRTIMLNRINNVAEFFQSVTFAEFAKILRALPANIYLKDHNGRYIFSSQTWHHLDTGGDPNWTIRGKTDLDIRKDKENAKLAMASDMRILENGKGTSYIIEENDDGIQEFLQLIKEPIFNAEGKTKGIIALINNVTEQERMRRQLEELSTTDYMTGAYNRTSFEETIQKGICQEDCPVVILTGDCDNLKDINDTYGHQAGDEWIRTGASLIQNRLPEGGKLFRTGGDEFTALIPHMDAEGAEELIRLIQTDARTKILHGGPYGISLGYAVAETPCSDVSQYLFESDEAMYRCKRERKAGRE